MHDAVCQAQAQEGTLTLLSDELERFLVLGTVTWWWVSTISPAASFALSSISSSACCVSWSFEINIACCAISISKSDLTSISALASGCVRRGAIIVQARKLVRKFAPLPRSQVTLD